MFDKYKANEITKVYMEKYAELKHIMKIVNDNEEITDDLLTVNSLLNVYIEPTNRCNLSCVFCARENMKRNFDVIDIEVFKRTIDSLPKGTYITLTGNGEPTINVHIYDMIAYAAEKGMHVSIITNACTLNDKNRKKLINSGISRIQLSFQSLDKETDEKIMRGASYEKQLLNILKLIHEIRTSNKMIYISISKVEIEESAHFSEVTKRFWNKIPIDNYYEGEYLSLQTDSGIYEKTEADEEYIPCAEPWIAVKVNASGEVNPCPLDFSSKYVIGNIKEDSLGNILNSDKAIAFKKALLTGDMEFLDNIGYCCKDCNTWKSKVNGSIPGVMAENIPIRLGLVINEISGDKPTNTEFLDKAIDLLESGETDLIHTLMED